MSRLAGRRILLVEDELLIAMVLEEALGAEGCVIVGPFPRLEPALKAAREERLDAAVLDINLAGARVYPVAKVLAERNVPFVFTTGYQRDTIPPAHADRPALVKPYRKEQLIHRLVTLLQITSGGALDRQTVHGGWQEVLGVSTPNRRFQ